MKAVRCCDKHVHVVDVPAPTGEGVLVNVRSAGICGSDLHMIRAGFDLPMTLGHEVAGTLSDGRAVALDVGYHSEAAFSRAFKRFIGVSPGAVRRRAYLGDRVTA